MPLAGEFRWGNNNIFSNPQYYFITNNNQTSEGIGNAAATPFSNANYSNSYAGTGGPVRNGIFATSTSNRISSGGSFYGIMELSGNLIERVVTSANILGRNLDTTFAADGELSNAPSAYGYASMNSWPRSFKTTTFSFGLIDGSNNAVGLIYRGEGWLSDATNLQTSNRSALLVTDANTIRAVDVGVRGCLSAP